MLEAIVKLCFCTYNIAWRYLSFVDIYRFTSGEIYQKSLNSKRTVTSRTTNLALGLNACALKTIQLTSIITASLIELNCAAGHLSKLSTRLPGSD